ncbi:uncharacterized protein EKO05_0007590 [Ascochyta rabiei]|uniref:uncharacterized protein n=1 Tax=Didymella rabiei TaxID=5454 RepID=UPI0021FEE689|nr:uncharacterized protein EKO05_0007590 [Ascochyta rabiei]UPX17223.1 hypothetical protein EKO05_0007590 [Ascochyta rabiei]
MSSANNTAATAPPASSPAPVSSAAPAPASSAPAPSSAAPPASSAAPPASSAAPPASSAEPAPSSAEPAPSSAAPAPSSAAPAPAPSSAAPSSAAPAPSSAPAPVTTQVVTASSAPPSTTEVATSVVTVTPSATRAGETPTPIIVTSVVTREGPVATTGTGGLASTATTRGASSTSTAEPKSANGITQKGLSTGGKTAIAVVVPVVVVALLVLAGIILWRKRKARQNNEEERRKEVEEYGFNPNHDPTLPAVGGIGGAEMAEDSSGYRGWGNTATSSNRKASTTLTSGMTYSDSNSNPGGYNTPHSPTGGAYSEGSNDPLVNGRRETMDSDGLGALDASVIGGAVPNSTQNQAGVQRGPSNASSSYSAANRSDASGEYPGMAANPNEYYDNQGYYQTSPYGNTDPYGTGQQPVIRDVSARRNTRIENPSVFPQQGNSGIAQNF